MSLLKLKIFIIFKNSLFITGNKEVLEKLSDEAISKILFYPIIISFTKTKVYNFIFDLHTLICFFFFIWIISSFFTYFFIYLLCVI